MLATVLLLSLNLRELTFVDDPVEITHASEKAERKLLVTQSLDLFLQLLPHTRVLGETQYGIGDIDACRFIAWDPDRRDLIAKQLVIRNVSRHIPKKVRSFWLILELLRCL